MLEAGCELLELEKVDLEYSTLIKETKDDLNINLILNKEILNSKVTCKKLFDSISNSFIYEFELDGNLIGRSILNVEKSNELILDKFSTINGYGDIIDEFVHKKYVSFKDEYYKYSESIDFVKNKYKLIKLPFIGKVLLRFLLIDLVSKFGVTKIKFDHNGEKYNEFYKDFFQKFENLYKHLEYHNDSNDHLTGNYSYNYNLSF